MAAALRVAIVADDLTGALDAAAPFAARGLRTCVAVSAASLDAALSQGCEVVAVNTRTRHCPAIEAASAVSAVIRNLASLTPDILFKKVDSTLRGNVAAEITAARKATHRPAVVCPAVPAQGRTLWGGHVFVHGEPLASTSIGQDVRGAPPERSLTELLAAGIPGIRTTTTAADLDASSHADFVVDVRSTPELEQLARAIAGVLPARLMVGAAGLATALATLRYGPPRCDARLPRPSAQIAFVVGSRTPETAAQVARLLRMAPGYRYVSALDQTMSERQPTGNIVVVPGMSPIKNTVSPDEVADRMAAEVCCWLGTARAPGLLLTGGDTALAVVDRLACSIVDVHGELETGVVCASLLRPGDPVPVITKAGGFGDKNLFIRVHQSLQAGSLDVVARERYYR